MNFFKKINPNVPEKKQSQIVNPIIYSDENPEFYIIIDTYNSKIKSYFRRAIQQEYDRPVAFALIYPYLFKPKGNDLTKNITQFVTKYSIDFTKYIPKGSKILASGRGLYALLKDTSLQASAFYPIEFVDQYLYHPDTESWIFPIDDIWKFIDIDQKRFLDNFENFFFLKQIQNIKTFEVPKLRIPKLKRIYIEEPNKFLEEHLNDECELAWDLETSGLIFYKDTITCITMSFDGRTGYYLDFDKIDLKLLNKFFANKYQIGANLKFDCKFLRYRGVSNAKIDFDTLSAGHCINETRSNSLSSDGWTYTYYGGHEQPLKEWKMKHPHVKNYANIPKSVLKQYAIDDAIVCFQVYLRMKQLLANESALEKYYFEEVIPNQNLFLEIELAGVNIDWELLRKLKKDYTKEQKEIEAEIYKEVGFKFNISSLKTLGKVLEETMHFPDLGFRAKESIGGYYLTGMTHLNTWISQGYKLAELIKKYREVSTFINTFIGDEKEDTAYWYFRNKDLDTVHPNYRVMLARSHRNKCYSPNLQQVPKRGDKVKSYRLVFTTPRTENEFVLSKKSIKLEMENNLILEYPPNQKCKVIRNSKEYIIEVKDILENDDFIKEI